MTFSATFVARYVQGVSKCNFFGSRVVCWKSDWFVHIVKLFLITFQVSREGQLWNFGGTRKIHKLFLSDRDNTTCLCYVWPRSLFLINWFGIECCLSLFLCHRKNNTSLAIIKVCCIQYAAFWGWSDSLHGSMHFKLHLLTFWMRGSSF